MGAAFRTMALIVAVTVPCSSARLSAPAQRAFDTYAAAIEKTLAEQHANPSTYLTSLNVGDSDRAELERQLRSGAMLMQPVNGGTRSVAGGLLHDWRGVAFPPVGSAAERLAV